MVNTFHFHCSLLTTTLWKKIVNPSSVTIAIFYFFVESYLIISYVNAYLLKMITLTVISEKKNYFACLLSQEDV